MKHIKLFEQFARKDFYHFSENANLKLGESLNSALCKDPFYLETVMPIYRHLAEKKGIEWPVNHGYAFSGENGPVFWIYGSKKWHNSEDIRAKLKTKLNCYRVKAESETISGPMDFSPGACTMLFKNADSANLQNYTIEEFAKNYFRTDFNLDMAEWICDKFIIEEKLESSDWKVMYADDEW